MIGQITNNGPQTEISLEQKDPEGACLWGEREMEPADAKRIRAQPGRQRVCGKDSSVSKLQLLHQLLVN